VSARHGKTLSSYGRGGRTRQGPPLRGRSRNEPRTAVGQAGAEARTTTGLVGDDLLGGHRGAVQQQVEVCLMCSARISSGSTCPAARAASTLEVTRSTTSRTYPVGVMPSSSAAHAAPTGRTSREASWQAWRLGTVRGWQAREIMGVRWTPCTRTIRTPRCPANRRAGRLGG
jgi:hypothetical protein